MNAAEVAGETKSIISDKAETISDKLNTAAKDVIEDAEAIANKTINKAEEGTK